MCVCRLGCDWKFKGVGARSLNALAEYRNEKMFFAQLLGDIIYLGAGHHYLQFKTPLIRFLVTPGNWGFNIAEVAMSYGTDICIQKIYDIKEVLTI